MAPLFVLARQGRVFEVIAFVFMFTTIFLLRLESVRPKLRLRKRPLPKPTIRLDIDSPSNYDITGRCENPLQTPVASA